MVWSARVEIVGRIKLDDESASLESGGKHELIATEDLAKG